MDILSITQFLQSNQSYQSYHLLILSIIFLATWSYSVRGKFLIDDHEGVEQYSDKFIVIKDKDGKVTKEEVVNTYKQKIGDAEVNYRNIAFNPHLGGIFVSILRWIRINVGKRFQVIAKNEKGHEVYGYLQSPLRHHIFSLLIHFANIVLAYRFLSRIFSPELAFCSTLLFTVHPISCQSVAWISGIGYLLSILFSLIGFNLSFLVSHEVLKITIAIITSYLSASSLMAGFANPIIYIAIGDYWSALGSFIGCLIVAIEFGRGAVTHRKKMFIEQQMGRSTNINLRKLIIIVKTFYYYIKMLIFPKRLGLFHKFGYHYDETLERFDGMFFRGVISVILLLAIAIISPFEVRFALIWLFSYLVLFSNIITAQQFVADRYAFISSFGFCILIAYFLKDHPIILSFIIGLYMMRNLQHLPAFENDEELYKSNVHNFPDSEVALGNLGVIYNQKGMSGTAADCWNRAVNINPFYDVPNYNLYSLFKASGMLEQAHTYLKRCLNAKTVHFLDQWTKEEIEFTKTLERKKQLDSVNAELNKAIVDGEYMKIGEIKERINQARNSTPAPT